MSWTLNKNRQTSKRVLSRQLRLSFSKKSRLCANLWLFLRNKNIFVLIHVTIGSVPPWSVWANRAQTRKRWTSTARWIYRLPVDPAPVQPVLLLHRLVVLCHRPLYRLQNRPLPANRGTLWLEAQRFPRLPARSIHWWLWTFPITGPESAPRRDSNRRCMGLWLGSRREGTLKWWTRLSWSSIWSTTRCTFWWIITTPRRSNVRFDTVLPRHLLSGKKSLSNLWAKLLFAANFQGSSIWYYSKYHAKIRIYNFEFVYAWQKKIIKYKASVLEHRFFSGKGPRNTVFQFTAWIS